MSASSKRMCTWFSRTKSIARPRRMSTPSSLAQFCEADVGEVSGEAGGRICGNRRPYRAIGPPSALLTLFISHFRQPNYLKIQALHPVLKQLVETLGLSLSFLLQ